MKIRNLVLPAGLALALVVGACANATSTPEGSSVGMDKDAKAAACCPEMDKAACAEAKAAGKCEGSKMSCDKAKAEGETAPGSILSGPNHPKSDDPSWVVLRWGPACGRSQRAASRGLDLTRPSLASTRGVHRNGTGGPDGGRVIE